MIHKLIWWLFYSRIIYDKPCKDKHGNLYNWPDAIWVIPHSSRIGRIYGQMPYVYAEIFRPTNTKGYIINVRLYPLTPEEEIELL